MDKSPVSSGPENRARRIIKRYSNRKLYDTRDSRYVTLLQIAEMVRAGEDVQIIDNATKEDKTEVTLALIISEELKAQPRSVPLGQLREMIQERGERLLGVLREGPIGRLIPAGGEEKAGEGGEPVSATPQEPPPEAKAGDSKHPDAAKSPNKLLGFVESSKQTIDQWQHAVDDRVRAVLPNFAGFRDLQTELKRLTAKVEELESRLRTRGDEGGKSKKE